jgi:hypothetical protein
MALPASFGLALGCAVTVSLNRPVPDWPYERLMRESGIVAVATPVAVKNVDYDFGKDEICGRFLESPLRRLRRNPRCDLELKVTVLLAPTTMI